MKRISNFVLIMFCIIVLTSCEDRIVNSHNDNIISIDADSNVPIQSNVDEAESCALTESVKSQIDLCNTVFMDKDLVSTSINIHSPPSLLSSRQMIYVSSEEISEITDLFSHLSFDKYELRKCRGDGSSLMDYSMFNGFYVTFFSADRTPH